MNWIESRLQSFWLRVAESASLASQEFGCARIVTGIFILVVYLPHFSWISEVPQGFFDPPYYSLGAFLNNFPSKVWLVGLDFSILICTLMLTLGVWARTSGCILFCALTIGTTLSNSFGKIDHVFLLIVFLLGMSFTNWGRQFALLPDPEVPRIHQRYALAILAFLLSFGMLSAGTSKAFHWLDFNLEEIGFLGWFYAGYFNYGSEHLLADYIFLFPPSFFELFDYVAIAFQLSPFFALYAGRRWWTLWLLTASVFHLTNALLLNIPFTMHLPAYFCFCSFSLSETQLRVWKRPGRAKILAISLVTITLVWQVWSLLNSGHLSSISEGLLSQYQQLVLACILWLSLISVFLFTARKEHLNIVNQQKSQ